MNRHHKTREIKFSCGMNLEDELSEKVIKLLQI